MHSSQLDSRLYRAENFTFEPGISQNKSFGGKAQHTEERTQKNITFFSCVGEKRRKVERSEPREEKKKIERKKMDENIF